MKLSKLRLLGGLGDWTDGAPAEENEEGVDAATVLRVRTLLGELSAGGAPQELESFARELGAHSGELHAAAVTWIGLVETLIQDAEGRNPRSGRGPLKLDEVKWVLSYLFRRLGLRISGIPGFLAPLLDDALADVTVDALVSVLNDHGLLHGTAVTRRARFAGELRWLAHQIARPLSVVLSPLRAAASWLAGVLRFRPQLSPALRSSIAAIEAQHGDLAPVFDAVGEFAAWLAAHSDVTSAAFQLVWIAVDEAETFASLDGPQKKSFAENTVLAVLHEMGVGTGLLGSVLTPLLVDAAIDGLVGVFNARGWFTHSGR